MENNKNTQYELNKGLAQMLKGGVIMVSPARNRPVLPKPREPAPSWRWSESRLISGLPAAYPG